MERGPTALVSNAADSPFSLSHPKEQWVARLKAPFTGEGSSVGVNHHEATEPFTVHATTFPITTQPQLMLMSHTIAKGMPYPLKSQLS